MLEDFLRINKIEAKIHFVPEGTKTAAEAQKAFASAGLQVVKSIVLVDSEKNPLLVILKGEDTIDFKKIKILLGAGDVRLAQTGEVLEITGYEVGGVPPISIYGVKTIIDSGAATLGEVLCGGGTKNHLMQIKMDTILKNIDDAAVADVKKV